jgi:hypothetical protein
MAVRKLSLASVALAVSLVVTGATDAPAAPKAHTDAPSAKAKGAPKPAAQDKSSDAGATADKTRGVPASDAGPEKGVAGDKKGAPGAPNVVKTEENKEGVKTYNFGAVEVEGRLRSPQLIYFLRRVRAEFLAGDLGHRSFLPELSETQRSATFR